MMGERAAAAHRADEPQDMLASRFYRRIRDSGPVFRTGAGTWVVAGHPEAVSVLGSRSSSSAPAGRPTEESTWDTLARRFFIFSDGAEHTRLRRLVSDGFTNRHLRAVSETIEAIIRQRAAG